MLYGSPGVGNLLHLAPEVFAQKAGITLQHVPYKGASEVATALLGGSVQLMFVTPVSVIGLVKDGKMRALAFTGTKPFPEFPDVPLLKDLVPGYSRSARGACSIAPGKTPDAIVDKLNAGGPRGAERCRRWPASCSATATFPTTATPPRPRRSSARRSRRWATR